MPNRHTFVDPEHSSFHLASCSSPKGLCTTKAASPLGGNPIQDGFGFDPFPESLCANGVMTLSSMTCPPCRPILATDNNVPQIQDFLVFGNRKIAMIQGVKLLVQPLRPTTTGYKH